MFKTLNYFHVLATGYEEIKSNKRATAKVDRNSLDEMSKKKLKEFLVNLRGRTWQKEAIIRKEALFECQLHRRYLWHCYIQRYKAKNSGTKLLLVKA